MTQLTIAEGRLSNARSDQEQNFQSVLQSISMLVSPAVDDLGMETVYEDEQDTHSMLSNSIFRGVRNRRDLLRKLRRYSLNYVRACIKALQTGDADDIDYARQFDPTILTLYQKLLELNESDPGSITAFVTDYITSTNRYDKTILPDSRKEGRRSKGKIVTLNEVKRNQTPRYMMNAMTGNIKSESLSVYDGYG